MGRVIRKVPKGWEHPKNERGRFIPMSDQTFKEAADEWTQDFLLWVEGKHSSQKDEKIKGEYPYYWQFEGDPPDEESYRPEFTAEAKCFQIYENVSEGTPTSPVFESKKELIEWLVSEGFSRKSAEIFAKDEYVPSMIAIPGIGIKKGIEACEFMGERKKDESN